MVNQRVGKGKAKRKQCNATFECIYSVGFLFADRGACELVVVSNPNSH